MAVLALLSRLPTGRGVHGLVPQGGTMPGEHGYSEQAVWHLLQSWPLVSALFLLFMLTLSPGCSSPSADKETWTISPAAPE